MASYKAVTPEKKVPGAFVATLSSEPEGEILVCGIIKVLGYLTAVKMTE